MTDETKNPGAFGVQVDGSHYSKLAIQPMFFCTTNGYDPALFSAFKYLSRFEDKGGPKDLEKAIHCIQLREDMILRPMFMDVWGFVASLTPDWMLLRARKTAEPWRLPMSTYISANEISDDEKAHVLMAFEAYSRGVLSPRILIEKIRELKGTHYGNQENV